MQVLDMVVAPLLLVMLMVVAYGYVFQAGESSFIKKIIRWIVVFIVPPVPQGKPARLYPSARR